MSNLNSIMDVTTYIDIEYPLYGDDKSYPLIMLCTSNGYSKDHKVYFDKNKLERFVLELKDILSKMENAESNINIGDKVRFKDYTYNISGLLEVIDIVESNGDKFVRLLTRSGAKDFESLYNINLFEKVT